MAARSDFNFGSWILPLYFEAENVIGKNAQKSAAKTGQLVAKNKKYQKTIKKFKKGIDK